MGADRLDLWSLLVEGELVGIDTSIFIYFMNRQEPYYELSREILQRIESGQLRAVISTVNQMEMLVEPLAAGKSEIVNDIEDLLLRLTWIRIIPVDSTIARRAAALRAGSRLPGLDCLIGATAITSGCRHIIGNDNEFAKRVNDIRYLTLDEFV